MREPERVRLIRNIDDRVVGTSPVVDMSGGNGGIIWLILSDRRVRVGADVVFTDVPALNAVGEPLREGEQANRCAE